MSAEIMEKVQWSILHTHDAIDLEEPKTRKIRVCSVHSCKPGYLVIISDVCTSADWQGP